MLLSINDRDVLNASHEAVKLALDVCGKKIRIEVLQARVQHRASQHRATSVKKPVHVLDDGGTRKLSSSELVAAVGETSTEDAEDTEVINREYQPVGSPDVSAGGSPDSGGAPVVTSGGSTALNNSRFVQNRTSNESGEPARGDGGRLFTMSDADALEHGGRGTSVHDADDPAHASPASTVPIAAPSTRTGLPDGHHTEEVFSCPPTMEAKFLAGGAGGTATTDSGPDAGPDAGLPAADTAAARARRARKGKAPRAPEGETPVDGDDAALGTHGNGADGGDFVAQAGGLKKRKTKTLR